MSTFDAGEARGRLTLDATQFIQATGAAAAQLRNLSGVAPDGVEFGRGLGRVTKQMDVLNQVVRSNWWGIRALAASWQIAAVTMGTAIAGLIGSMTAWEDDMAGVARTTYDAQRANESLAEANLRNAATVAVLSRELNALTRIKPMKAGQLLNIAEEAGALGIAAKDIDEFTAVVADLDAVTDLTTDQAIKGFGTLSAVMGLMPQDFEHVASAILELGRSTAATEPEILALAQRMAGIASVVGLTIDQLLSLSATMASLRIPAQAGGTAIQKTFIDMNDAVSQGDRRLAVFAATAGISTAEFAAKFREDAMGALILFIDGLGRLGDEGLDVTATLNQLGIVEARQVQAILKLAEAQGRLTQDLQKGSKAYHEGTVLQEITERRYATLANQIKLFRNSIEELGRSYGVFFITPLKIITGLLTTFTTGLNSLPDPLRKVLTAFASGATVLLALGAAAFTLGPKLIQVRAATIQTHLAIATFNAQLAETDRSLYKQALAITGVTGKLSQHQTQVLAAAQAEKQLEIDQLKAAVATNTFARSQATLTTAMAAATAEMARQQSVQAKADITSQSRLVRELSRAAAENQRQFLASTEAMDAASQRERNRIQEINSKLRLERERSFNDQVRSEGLSDIQKARLIEERAALELAVIEKKRQHDIIISRKKTAASNAATALEEARVELTIRQAAAQQAGLSARETAAAVKVAAAEEALARKNSEMAIRSLANAERELTLVTRKEVKERVALTQEEEAIRRAAAAVARTNRIMAIGGRVLGVMTLGMTALSAVTLLQGRATKEAADEQERLNRANNEMVAAVGLAIQGSDERLRSLLAEAIATAGVREEYEKLNLTYEHLHAVIAGTDPALAQQFFDATRDVNDEGVQRLFDVVAALRGEYVAALPVAEDQLKVTEDAGIATDALTESDAELARMIAEGTEQAMIRARAVQDLIDAQFGLRSAEFALQEAELALAEAHATAVDPTRAIEKATIDLAIAQLRAQKAARNLLEKEIDLLEARAKEQRRLEKAQEAVHEASFRQRDATLNLIEAQQKLNDLQVGSEKNIIRIRDAELKLRRAQLDSLDSAQDLADANFNLNYLRAEGASQRDIAEAELLLMKAQLESDQSAADLVDTQKELKEALAGPNPEELAEAQLELDKAQRAVEESARDAAEAQRELGLVQRDIAEDRAYRDAELELLEARLEHMNALDNIRIREWELAKARLVDPVDEIRRAELELEQARYRVATATTEIAKQSQLATKGFISETEEALLLAQALEDMGFAAEAAAIRAAAVPPPTPEVPKKPSKAGTGGDLGVSLEDQNRINKAIEEGRKGAEKFEKTHTSMWSSILPLIFTGVTGFGSLIGLFRKGSGESGIFAKALKGGFTGIAKGFAGVVGGIGKGLGILRVAFTGFATFLMANPVLLIWIAIAVAVAGLVYLIIKYWDEIMAVLGAAWDWISSTAMTVWNGIRDFFKKFWPIILAIMTGGIGLIVLLIVRNWDTIRDVTVGVFNAIRNFFAEFWPIILGIITGGIGLIVLLIVKNWSTVRDVTLGVFGAIRDFVVEVWGIITGVITGAVSHIAGFITDLLGGAANVVIGAWNNFIEGIQIVWQTIRDIFWGSVSWIYDNVTRVFREIVDAVVAIWNGLIGFFHDLWGIIWNVIKQGINLVIGLINIFIRGINGALSMINWIPGVNVKIPEIPELQTGGTARRQFIAMLHPGEGVINRQGMDEIMRLLKLLNHDLGGQIRHLTEVLDATLTEKQVARSLVATAGGTPAPTNIRVDLPASTSAGDRFVFNMVDRPTAAELMDRAMWEQRVRVR